MNREFGVGLLSTLLAVSLLAGCQSGAAATDQASEPAPVAVQLVKAERAPIRKLVEVTGSFAPSQGGFARLAPATSGRVTRVFVGEGDHVAAGQLLAQIESSVQGAQQDAANQGAVAARQQAEEAATSSQAAKADQAASVTLAAQAVVASQMERESSVAQAEADVRLADAELRKVRAGARPEELAQAHQVTVQAEVTRDRAKKELDRDNALAKEGFVAKRDLEDSQAAFDTAQSALESAKAAEALTKAGARPEELESAQLRLSAARAALENAKRSGEIKVSQAQTALAQAKQGQLQVQAKVRDAEATQSIARQRSSEASAAAAQSSQTEVRAPFSGQISRRFLNPGDSADPSIPILEMTASGRVDFVAGVLLSDAVDVRPGMEAEIDLAGGKMAHARVASVSPGDPTTGLSTVRMITASSAPIGAFCRAKIVIARHPSAVVVPKETILDRDGQSVVFIVQGDTAKMTSVETGAEDDGKVEILKGVDPGDQLVQLGQFELSDGAKVKAEALGDGEKDKG